MEVFSNDDMSALRNIFALMDHEDCGKISMEEMKQLLNSQNCYPTEAELAKIIEEVDFDRDGEINFEDFVMYCSKRGTNCSALQNDRAIKQAFNFLDRNGDGYVTARDISHVMRTIGRDMAEEQAEQMLAEVDKDGDGRISYECFKNVMEDATYLTACLAAANSYTELGAKIK